MYTKVGRILSKQEAQKFYNMIRMIVNDMQVDELTMRFNNPATSTTIKVNWTRSVGLRARDWESLSVEFNSPHVSCEEELFDDHHSFGQAYELEVV
jgi:hypothetical protein